MRTFAILVILTLSAAFPMGLPAQDAPPDDRAESATGSPELSPHAAGRAGAAARPGGFSSVATTIGSLALVLGVFFLLLWAFRRASPNAARALPKEVLEVLGHAPLGNRRQATMLRWGNRLLLISAGAAETEALAEITDAAEVERLTDLCRQASPSGPVGAVRRMFGQKERHDG